MKTRLKQLEASIAHLRGRCEKSKNHQHKAIFRKNLHYAMVEYNELKGKQ